MEPTAVLGVDLGGVILDWASVKDTELAFSGDRYLETPYMPDVFESLRILNDGKFKENIYVISKHDHYGPGRMLEWLEHHNFYSRTGIPKEHLNFCTERAEKAAICERLGVTHFVDDRLEVLSHLMDIVPTLYLFHPSDVEIEKFKDFLPKVQRVETWKELTGTVSVAS